MLRYFKSILFASMLVLASCVSDPAQNEVPHIGPHDGEAEVILRLQIPGGFQQNTRLSLAEEKEVANVWVLVFDDNDFLLEIKQAQDLKADGTFTVMLAPTSEGRSVRLVLLANSNGIMSSTIGFDAADVVNKAYDDVMAEVCGEISGPMFPTTGTIPMWGETALIEIKPGSTNQTVDLMRSVARIDVGVGQMTTTQQTDGKSYSWNGLEKDGVTEIPFELREVYVIRPNKQFRVAPESSNYTRNSAHTPSLPDDVECFDVDESESAFVYTDISENLYTQRSIYIPEAEVIQGGRVGDENHTERMAVVVGGSYKGGATSYYRMDFATGVLLDDVLRNHLYSFSIQGVRGPGSTTVEQAYQSLATNLIVNVLEWDDDKINDVYFDGTYYLAIDKRSLRFDPLPGTLQMHLRTNIEHFEFWRNDHLTDGDPATDPVKLVWDPDENSRRLTFQGDQRYEWTLERDPENMTDGWVVTVVCPVANIGTRRPQSYAAWTIVANRLQVAIDLDQDFVENGLMSFVDGQQAYMMPEGGEIPVDVVSLVSGTISATNSDGTPADWIDLGDTSALSTSDKGYFQYTDNFVIAPFELTEDSPVSRTATVTVNLSDGKSVSYIITQEAPYLTINRDVVYIQRPGSGTQPVQASIEVFTNLPDSEFTLVQGDGADEVVLPAGMTLTAYDPRNPRNRRFFVEVSFDGAPEDAYGRRFTIELTDPGKYGTLIDEAVEVVVPPANQRFNGFWYKAIFIGGVEWEVPERFVDAADATRYSYIFPWNTTNILLDTESNIGIEPDEEHTFMDNAGVLTLTHFDEDTPEVGTTRYYYDLALNNQLYSTVSQYTMAFRATMNPDPLIQMTGETTFRQGVQVWEREDYPNDGTLSYEGRPQVAPDELLFTSNVKWTAAVSYTQNPGQTGWVQIAAQQDKTGGQTFAFGQNLTVDDHFYAPVNYPDDPSRTDDDYEYHTNEILVNTTELKVSVDEWDELNPTANPMRQATIAFTNNDYSQEHLGVSVMTPVTITQWARRLSKTHTNLPNTNISGAGGNYQFHALTNIPNWQVKIYDVTDGVSNKTLLVTGTYAPGTVGNSANTLYANAVSAAAYTTATVPENPTTELRELQFVLSAPVGIGDSQEQSIELNYGTWTQDGAPGVLAPPGVLGVGVVSKQLTVRGSMHFAGTSYEADSPTGRVSDETVYVAYFKWGSLVGLSSVGKTGDAFSIEDIVWAPDEVRSSVMTAVNNASTAAGKWTAIPYADNNLWPTANDLERGVGDPCTLADNGTNRYWRTPNSMHWMTNYSVGFDHVTINAGGVQISGHHSWTGATNRVFAPYAGYRDADNGGTIQYNGPNGPTGYYWSSTISGSNPATMTIWNSGTSTTNRVDRTSDDAVAIRCFRNMTPQIQAPPSMGLHAPPGTLGVSESGDLTLRGSKLFDGTPVEAESPFGQVHEKNVYIVYFKWGSTVAMSSDSSLDNIDFDAYDVVWTPEGYNYTQLLNNMGDMSGSGAYALVPSPGAGYSYPAAVNSAGDLTNGYGDPCLEADKGSRTYTGTWRTPAGTATNWGGAVNVAQALNDTPGVELTNGQFVAGMAIYYGQDWESFIPYSSWRTGSDAPQAGNQGSGATQGTPGQYSTAHGGRFWSRNRESGDNIYALSFIRNGATAMITSNYTYGYAVRCFNGNN